MPGKKKLEDKNNTKPKKEEIDNEEYEQEKFGSKVLLAVVTLLIVLIWLGIIALLIKMVISLFVFTKKNSVAVLFGCGNLADCGQLRRASVGFDRLFGNKI